MKRIVALLAAALVVSATGLAAAAPTTLPDLPVNDKNAGPGPGGISSDNLEWLSNIGIAVDGVGGRKVGKYFYMNDQHKVLIFDVSEPESPALTGQLLMPQEFLFGREDLDTNGKIMVLPQLGTLHVIDVEDKTNPQIIASLGGAGQHTNSCILNCTWAYGSSGNIVDLRDPANPKLMQERWGDGNPAQGGHDVTEVAPGIVLTSTQPMMLLDARKNPRKPRLLAAGFNADGRFIHSNIWPRKGKDKFILAGGETNNQPRCNERNGAFMTWDATTWKKNRTFNMIDEYRVTNGTYIDGNPAVNVVGCSSHWLESHPKFKNGGLVAAAFFEHGTRLLQINKKGKIKETGYFTPWGGSTGAVYWITDEILYAVDYTRGMDILRYTGKK